jgi:hypothetical protein
VRNEAPSHRVHDERRLLWLSATDDGSMSARGNVVAGHMAVSVHPLVDVKCRITVELLCFRNMRNFRELFLYGRGSLEARVRICRTALAGIADRGKRNPKKER